MAHLERLGDSAAVRALASNGAALILARGGPDGLDDPSVRRRWAASRVRLSERPRRSCRPRWRRQERAGDPELVAIFDRLRRARAAWQEAGMGLSGAEWEADPQVRAFFASLDRAARDP